MHRGLVELAVGARAARMKHVACLVVFAGGCGSASPPAGSVDRAEEGAGLAADVSSAALAGSGGNAVLASQAAAAAHATSAEPELVAPNGCRIGLAPAGDRKPAVGPALVLQGAGQPIWMLTAAGAIATLPRPGELLFGTHVHPNGPIYLAHGSGFERIEPDGAVTAIGPQAFAGLNDGLWVLSPNDAWAAPKLRDFEWGLRHFDGTSWKAAPFPDGEHVGYAPYVAAAEGRTMLVDGDGLWLWEAGAWKEDPSVPGSGHLRLYASRGRPVVVESRHAWMRTDAVWNAVSPWPADHFLHEITDAGLVLATEGVIQTKSVWVSSVDGDCALEIGQDVLRGRDVFDVTADERGRIWIATEHGIVVMDRAAQVVADWLPGTVDGFEATPVRIAIGGRGPDALPEPRTVPRRGVRGRIVHDVSQMPVAGATVRIGVGDMIEIEAKTDASGRFVLRDVPHGQYQVEVVPPKDLCAGRAPSSAFPFATASCADGATPCDVGDRRVCQQVIVAP